MSESLINIIVSPDPATRDRALESAVAGMSTRQLLKECEALDAFRAFVVVEARIDDRDVGDERRGQGDRLVRAAGAADDQTPATDGQKSRDAFPDPIVRVDDEDPKRDRPFGRRIRHAASVGQATPIPV